MITAPLFLGTFSIYAIILTCSAGLGLWLTWYLDPERRTLILDAGLGLVIISLAGARTGYVIRNLDYFLSQPLEIPQFWLGGLTWSGGFVGASLALIAIRLIWKEPLGELLDSYLPLFGILSAAIWLTSWWTGSGYGPETTAWFGIPVQDVYGTAADRWPFPILGAVLSAGWVAGVMLYPLDRGRSPGFRGLMAMLGLLVIQLLFSIFMQNPVPVFAGLRRESWFSILMVIFIAGAITWIDRRNKNEKAEP